MQGAGSAVSVSGASAFCNMTSEAARQLTTPFKPIEDNDADAAKRSGRFRPHGGRCKSCIQCLKADIDELLVAHDAG